MKSVALAVGFVLVAAVAANAYPLNTYPKGTTLAQYRAAEAVTRSVAGDTRPARIKDPSGFVVIQMRLSGDQSVSGGW